MANDLGITHLGRSVTGVQGPTPARPADRSASPTGDAEHGGAEAPPETARLDAVVSGINELVHELQRELHFAVDDQSGETVIKVVDRATDEVVRQIPSEEVLRLRQRLAEMSGALFDGSA